MLHLTHSKASPLSAKAQLLGVRKSFSPFLYFFPVILALNCPDKKVLKLL